MCRVRATFLPPQESTTDRIDSHVATYQYYSIWRCSFLCIPRLSSTPFLSYFLGKQLRRCVRYNCQLVHLHALVHVFIHFAGECISGLEPVGRPNKLLEMKQVIIPLFQFTDCGCITRLHLVGLCAGNEPGRGPTDNANTVQNCTNIVQVWRPSGGNRFSIAANFTATLAVTYNTVVTTSVAVNERTTFSSGDVLGFTPGADIYFGIYDFTPSTANQQTASHVYYTYNSFATELSANGSNRVSASPIISVEGENATHYEALTL